MNKRVKQRNKPSLLKGLLGTLLALATAACSPSVSQSPPDSAGEDRITLAVQWEADAGYMAPLLRPQINASGLVCTVSQSGVISFFNLENGNLQYEPVRIGGSRFDSYTAGVGCTDQIAAAVNSDGWLRVQHISDGLLWEKNLKTRVFGAPLITRGRLFNIGLDGRLLSFTLKKGRELWRYVSPLENLVRTPLDSALTAAGDIVYGGIDNGAVVALDLSSGKTIWENTIALPGGNNQIANILDVTTPVLHGETVCAAAYTGGVACFDAASGDRRWSQELPAYTRVALAPDGERLFVTDIDGTLHAFDAGGGEPLWQNKTGAVLSAPAAVNNLVLVGGYGVVYAYSAADGTLAATLDLGSDDIISITALPDAPADALVLALNGSLFRIHSE